MYSCRLIGSFSPRIMSVEEHNEQMSRGGPAFDPEPFRYRDSEGGQWDDAVITAGSSPCEGCRGTGAPCHDCHDTNRSLKAPNLPLSGESEPCHGCGGGASPCGGCGGDKDEEGGTILELPGQPE